MTNFLSTTFLGAFFCTNSVFNLRFGHIFFAILSERVCRYCFVYVYCVLYISYNATRALTNTIFNGVVVVGRVFVIITSFAHILAYTYEHMKIEEKK